MQNIYLAGPFSWQSKILTYSKELEALGYHITAEWLTQEMSFTNADNSTNLKKPGLHAECQLLSNRDIRNIFEADTLVVFEPGMPLERNTRVAEFGLALGIGRQCVVIQPEDETKKDVLSNIFVKFQEVPPELSRYNLKPVWEFRSWDDFLEVAVQIATDGCGLRVVPTK